MNDDQQQPPQSLLPYEAWAEDAQRQVVVRAITHVAAEGLPGEHHFFITFRTDRPGVVIPTRLLAQYPEEMTIVLQHQFWDLKVDEAAGLFSVGLSFGGVPTILTIPFAAITGFADPFIQLGMRFRGQESAPRPQHAPPEPGKEAVAPEAASAAEPAPAPDAPDETPQVVSLDAFRRRTPPKE
jgi:uncharacterized protein